MDTPTRLACWTVGLAVLGAAVHFVRLPRHFRPDVPRRTREGGANGTMPLGVVLGDYFTAEGRRTRRHVLGYLVAAVLAFWSIPGLLRRQRDDRPPLLIGLLGGSVALTAALVGADVWAVRGRRRAGRVLYVENAAGRLVPAEQAAAPREYGPFFQRCCPVCERPAFDGRAGFCRLCDWEGDVDAPSPAEVRRARERFARHLSASEASPADPWYVPATPAEQALRRELQAAYDTLMARGARDDDPYWMQLSALHGRLRYERARAVDAEADRLETAAEARDDGGSTCERGLDGDAPERGGRPG